MPKQIHLALIATALLPALSASAVNRYFNTASSGLTWDNATTLNWGTASGGPYNQIFTAYNDAFFEGTGAAVASAGVNANTITFTTANYSLTGGTITLGSPGGGPAITVNAGLSATISTAFSRAGGGASMRKLGDGTLVLNGTTAFSGATYGLDVNQGALTLSGGGLDFSAGGNLFVGNLAATAGTLNVSGGTLNLGTKEFLIGQNATGIGFVHQTGGTITLGATGATNIGNFGTGTMILSGGTYNSARGVTVAIRGSSTFTVTGTSTATLTTLQLLHSDGVTGAGKTATANLDGGTLTVNTITRGSTLSTSVFNFNGGTLKAGAAAATLLSGLTRANIRNGGAIIESTLGNVTISQPLMHSNIGGDAAIDGGLAKSGGGDLLLTGAAGTYNGGTTVSAGRLVVSASGALGTGAVTVNPGAEVYVNSAPTLNNAFILSGDGGTGSTLDPQLRGAIRADSGILGGSITLAADASLGSYLSGTGTFSGAIGEAGGARTLSINKSNLNNPGTVVLSGGNTYTGGTVVHNGTLRLEGYVSTTGLIQVSAGATFGGGGDGGAVVLVDGATLAPGHTGDNYLSLTGLTLADTTTLRFDLDAPLISPFDTLPDAASDHVAVGGPLILDGKLRINPLAGFGTPIGGETWLLLTHNPGALTDQTLDVDTANSPALSPGLSYLIDTSNDGYVYLAVVPEAGTAGLFLLGLAALLRARKRR
jgi:autotransporter-associated beta strand protein